MGTLSTFLVACLFLYSYIPSNQGFSVGRSERSATGTLEGLHSSWLTRSKRHEGHLDPYTSDELEKHFGKDLVWLTDEQKQELRDVNAKAHERKEVLTKLQAFYEATTGETRTKATGLLKERCSAIYTAILTKEQNEEVKKLHESGTDLKDISKKIGEFIEANPDKKAKMVDNEYKTYCGKLYGLERKKRDHHEHGHESHHGGHTLEDYFKNHLSWLSDTQKEELKTLKSEGKSRKDLQDKVFSFYDGLSGEAKTKATELLQQGCRELITMVIGKENADKLKALREGGATHEEINKKSKEFIGEVTDAHKKQIAEEYEGPCKKVFGVGQSRKKRTAVDAGKFDEALKTHLSWLTDAQKEELKALKNEGKSFEDVQKKVFEFYEALSGEPKAKATQLLQEGCRTLIKELVGDEKAEELKKLRESGAAKSEIKEKIVKLMDELTDPEKKEKALKFAGGCQKVFEIDSAKVKRDAPQGKLDEYLKTHLSWLTDEQKESVKTLKAEGKPFNEIQDKVFEYYGKLGDDDKKKAKDQMQEGCRGLIKEIAGQEAADELKKLREGGASNTEIETKIASYMDKLIDEDKKATAVKYAPACKRVFDLGTSRKKRNAPVDTAKLDESLKTHLSWLTDDQKAAVKTLASEGKTFNDINDKVFEYYGQLSGEPQTKAKELMQGGCRALIKELAGDEKAEELKKLRESGASKEELKKKVVSFLDALTDEDKKQKALKYAPACQKIFDLDA